jgi:hypothetical protein
MWHRLALLPLAQLRDDHIKCRLRLAEAGEGQIAIGSGEDEARFFGLPSNATTALVSGTTCSASSLPVSVSRTISGTQQHRLAGGAIRIIKLGTFTRPTFFVKDAAHTRFIEAMAAALNKDVSAAPQSLLI